uniref:Uncharacterized protein n=1 Tax=Anguilla anguilla TaxID=7936 RepID=A0A0E9P743_ANGAN
MMKSYLCSVDRDRDRINPVAPQSGCKINFFMH